MDTVLVIDTVPVMATDLALGIGTRLRAAIMATGCKTCRTHVTECVKTCRTHVTEFVKTCRAHVTELCSCEWYSASLTGRCFLGVVPWRPFYECPDGKVDGRSPCMSFPRTVHGPTHGPSRSGECLRGCSAGTRPRLII